MSVFNWSEYNGGNLGDGAGKGDGVTIADKKASANIFALAVGQSAKITKINLSGAAANRLCSLGFATGKSVTVLGYSLFNGCVLLGIGHTRVAIRRAVADEIQIEPSGSAEEVKRKPPLLSVFKYTRRKEGARGVKA